MLQVGLLEGSRDEKTGLSVWPHETIEKWLYYAVAENKIDESKIRDSKIVQDQLQIIRLKEEAAERELDLY